MRTTILILLFFTIPNIVIKAQDFGAVDSRVALYPKRLASAEQLAALIDNDFTKDVNKIRALYKWLTHNIAYDMDAYLKGETLINFRYTDQEDFIRKKKAVEQHSVTSTLRTGKAVCEGYAQTFKKVSELMGIPCKVVSGYSKTSINDIQTLPDDENHAWNAVRINNKWYLLDTTWGAGYANSNRWTQKFNDFFFFTDPMVFAASHYPTEPEWAFTKEQLSIEHFFNTPIFEKAYFSNELKLISPLNGEISVKPGTIIEIFIDNISDKTRFYYAFKGNKYSKQISPTCEDLKCKFSIPYSDNESNELILFVNKKAVIRYKIIATK